MQQTPPSAPPFSQTCAFCRIIRGEEQAALVFEDALSLVFLDRRPLFPGHCLCVPKAHYETLADLPAALVGPVFQTVQRVERAIEAGLHAEGTFIGINNRISQSVPHLHIHLVPRRRKDGLRGFFWPRQSYPDEATLLEMQENTPSGSCQDTVSLRVARTLPSAAKSTTSLQVIGCGARYHARLTRLPIASGVLGVAHHETVRLASSLCSHR